MKKMIIFIGIVLNTLQISAQYFPEAASKVYITSRNANPYFAPFLDLVGASMNSMAFSLQKPDTTHHFHFAIGVNASYSPVSASMKSFTGFTESPYSPEKSLTLPTIFGKNESGILYDSNGNAFGYPGGFDITHIILAYPFIQVGTLYHTNFSGRYFGVDINGDLRRIRIIGFGLNHFISDHWKAKNYFISAGLNYTAFNLGEYLKGRHYMAQLSGGQTFRRFNYYGHITWQKGLYNLYYNDQETTGKATVDSKNNVRIGAGMSYRLRMIRIQCEASGFNPLTAAAGLALQF